MFYDLLLIFYLIIKYYLYARWDKGKDLKILKKLFF